MENKICSGCGKEKPLSEFGKCKKVKSGLRAECNQCRKDYAEKNKEHIKNYQKNYNLENKEELKKKKHEYYLINQKTFKNNAAIQRKNNPNYNTDYYQEHSKNNPWKYTFFNIKQRCENPKANDYKYYGGRGIKCLITPEEIKELWFRDKAYEMNKPNIDRKDNNGDYIFSNCRFIESLENLLKSHKERKEPQMLSIKFTSGELVKDVDWNSLPTNQVIRYMDYKFGNKTIRLMGYASYLRLKEHVEGVNVSFKGLSKIILVGQNGAVCDKVIIDLINKTIKKDICLTTEVYNNQPIDSKYWRQGEVLDKPNIYIKED
jgi:hypothetical protein